MTSYRPTTATTRFWGALLASLAALLPLLLFLLLALQRENVPHRPESISMRLLPLPAPVRSRPQEAARLHAQQATKRQRTSPIAETLTASVSAAAASAPERQPVAVAAAAAASSPASAPLDLRISKALLAGTRSEVGKMADASGAFTGDAPKSLDHQLKQGVAGSAKMDCLGPNEAGNILTVVVIAVQAARGKCAGQ